MKQFIMLFASSSTMALVDTLDLTWPMNLVYAIISAII